MGENIYSRIIGAMSHTADVPVPAVPAATLLLIRNVPLEVLMVKRRAKSSFASAWVFPGGVVDESDADEEWLPLLVGAEELSREARALRVAACRELYEETGVLLAVGANSGVPKGCMRESFQEMVRRLGLALPLNALLPFGHWITPQDARKRFDTHFFLCAAPPAIIAEADGTETVAVQWLVAAQTEAHAEFPSGNFLFPTLMNLHRLAESPDVQTALSAARAHKVVTVLPSVERRGSDLFAVIPVEAGYGVTDYLLIEEIASST